MSIETSDKLQRLQERQLALRAEMRSSDDHVAKCAKLGLDFGKTYPEELEAYRRANEEFNANEKAIAELQKRLESEQEEEMKIIHHNEEAL